MQLGKHSPHPTAMQGRSNKAAKLGVAAGLAQATTALLGAAPAFAGDKSWDIDTAVLYYGEADRVTAVEPVISATKKLEGDRLWNVKLVIDSLTGATPNGASPADEVQTFSTPSGKDTYQTPEGELPLDAVFKDTRAALSTQYTTPLGDTLKFSGGIAASREYDYQSIALNANIAKDLNQHNTTLSAGLALAGDRIKPVGGKPIPRSQMTIGFNGNKEGEDDNKTVTDLLLGVTQVMSPKWLMQLNYSLSEQSGYLNDAYKVVSLLDSDGPPQGYVYESRPDKRTKHSIFLRSKSHHGKDNVFDVSYRYHTDDWGIDSHTLDVRYRWQLNAHHYLEPHFRYYQQAGADFYVQGLDASLAELPANISSDSRLGEFTGTTFGAKYGYLFGDDKEVNLRIESYKQTGEHQSLPGNLQDRHETFPDLDAIIVQVGYSFKF